MPKKFIIIILLLLVPPHIFCQVLRIPTELTNAKMVLLGEPTHGDGAIFEKKFEIIRTLHENEGFNVLVFESGLYDNYKAYSLIQNGEASMELYRDNIYPMWSYTDTFEKLLNYLSTHPDLRLLGFDSQESGLFLDHFLIDLKKLLKQNNRYTINDNVFEELEKTLVLKDLESYVNNKIDSLSLYQNIENIRHALESVEKRDLMSRVIVQSFESAFSDMDFILKSLQKEEVFVQNPRDKQMAQNLIFVKELFPDEKIIAWGANYHFSNRIDDFQFTDLTENYLREQTILVNNILGHEELDFENEVENFKNLAFAKPMGRILKEKYGQELFSLAFTSYEGDYLGYHDETFPILEPPAESLEAGFKALGTKDTLLVLKPHQGKFYTSVLGYLPIYSDWKNIFDGIYYIEKMYPPGFKNVDFVGKKPKNPESNNPFSGVLKDHTSNMGISYGDVYYKNTGISTVTNREGEFDITGKNKQNDYLYFSAIGYETDSVKVETLSREKSNAITLKKTQDIILDEVVLVSERKSLTANEIVKKAQKNITANYVQKPYNQSFLYRVLYNGSKDSVIYGEETLIETYNAKGINGSNTPESKFYGLVKEFRSNYPEDYNIKSYGVNRLWVTLNRDIILSKANVLYRPNSYDLKKEGLVDYDGREVYKISFVNNSPGTFSTGYGYPAPKTSNGVIYIDANDFAVLKYEHCIERESFSPKRSENTFHRKHNIVQSYKKVGEYYFLNLLEISNVSDVYDQNNEFNRRNIQIQRLTSNRIETEKITPYDRSVKNLDKDISKKYLKSIWNEVPLKFNADEFNANTCN